MNALTLSRGCEVPRDLRGTEFDDLYVGAHELLEADGAPASIKDPTLRLYTGLCRFDRQYGTELAAEGQAVAKLGRKVLFVVDEILGTETNAAESDAAKLLHDVGKPSVGAKIVVSSHTGEDWRDGYMKYMRRHPVLGSQLAREAGLPRGVSKQIHASHGKQIFPPYADTRLNYEERRGCDSLRVADFYLAMWGRTTNRTPKSPERQQQLVDQDVEWVYGDYRESGEIIPAVQETLKNELPEDVARGMGRLSVWEFARA